MARKTIVELIDDIDGDKATQTVSFSLDGAAYEIDLSEENAERLRNDLGEWTARARRVSGARRRASGTTRASSQETAKIRSWARENGYQISDRGRISSQIREAYQAAH